jgi:hypothetical protein
VSLSARPEYFPVTVKVPVKTEVIKTELFGYPLFVDEDDLVYYEHSGNLYTTPDGITETLVLQLSTLSPLANRANWICKTRENGKYVLSTRSSGINVDGQIWTADSLAGPWTKKLDVNEITGLGNSHFRFSNCWHHYDGTQDLIFVGTYGTYHATNNPNPCNHVYMSLDEGATFTKILETPIVTTTVNNHIHALTYSPWDGWLWVVHGDGTNRGIMYSYDRGQNWVEVSTGEFGKGGWQPSSVVPLMNQVAFGSDNPISNGVLAWYRPETTEVGEVGYVHQMLNYDGQVLISRRGASISSMEAYIPLVEENNTAIFVTGDGGFSWHTAATFTKGYPFEIGFTNPDSNGYVWGASMQKFKVSEWQETTKWVKNRFVEAPYPHNI